MTTSDGNTPQEKIAKIVEKAAPAAKKTRKTTKKRQPMPLAGVIYVAGNSNVVATGDVHIHHHYGGNVKNREIQRKCSI